MLQMFGCVTADPSHLSQEQMDRYRGCYCGLCRSLGRCHGQRCRLCLTYDMTFLILLLSSLYEPEERAGEERCVVHPRKRHAYWASDFSDYAASMNVALAWYKCLDDWKDDRNILRWLQAKLFAKGAREAARRYPRQCTAIRQSLERLSALEAEKGPADALAAEFGNLMGELFVFYPEDHWSPALREFGRKLGAFVYIQDAVCDLEADARRDRFNPLLPLHREGSHFKPHLTLLMGDAAAAFEKLPLVQDVDILRNILYFGVWTQYNQKYETHGKEAEL